MSAEIAGVSIGNKLVKINNGLWKLSVQNSAGYELPSTGGSGNNIFYLLGVTLIGLAGAGFVMKRRWRKVVY